jgi:alkyldihydroxyacetonephosphate synthase
VRRWNGWGDDTISFPLPGNSLRFIRERVGEATPLPDASLEDVLAQVPPSRLPDHPLVTKSPLDRVRHARGQSLPDWLALRSGKVGVFPDGVAYPTSSKEVRNLLSYARESGAAIIPYGGGTSVVGHITPEKNTHPVLTVDMGRMNRLLSLDEESQTAIIGSGAVGPDVEAQLRAHGYTLGHFPQSFEFSTLGGWIATRSSGQQSFRYGRIERLFSGGKLETPVGTLEIPSFPASAAGPDLRELVLGSEGRLGILTEVTVRVTPCPEHERFHAVFFPRWRGALDAVRTAAQAMIPFSMLRLGNPAETQTELALSGRQGLVALAEKLLSLRGVGSDKCMLIFCVSGTRLQCRCALRQARGVWTREKGVHTGTYAGRRWAQTRFLTPYLRNSLWEKGYAVDTLETAVDWGGVDRMVNAIESALSGTVKEERERIHVFTHLSHLYPQGSSIYTTYIFRAARTYEETLARWHRLKTAASNAIVSNGGTISHQHGIGLDHAPYLAAEKGQLGIATIETVCRQFDPSGMMNPGKLVR